MLADIHYFVRDWPCGLLHSSWCVFLLLFLFVLLFGHHSAKLCRLFDDQEEVLAEDGQEIPTELGEAIVDLLDEEMEIESR